MGQRRATAAGGVVRFLIALSAICLILINGTSALLEDVAPKIAKTINPLTTNAQINDLRQSLDQNPGEEELRAIAEIAARTVARAPADARAYTWLAEVAHRQGNETGANDLFGKALSFDPNNLRATLNRLNLAKRNNDASEFFRRLDVVGRRWPDKFVDLLPAVEHIAKNETAAAELERILLRNPPWRSVFLQHFIVHSEGQAFVEKLFIREAERGKTDGQAELNTLISWFIENNSVKRAHKLFVQTLNVARRKELGYVFNPRFQPNLENSPFGWSKPECPASEVRLTGAAEGLAVRFLGKPARSCGIQQVVVVPPGKVNWLLRATAENLEIPAGLHWKLLCDQGSVLARIDIPPGSYGPRDFSETVLIPENNCASQVLELSTGERTSSWRNRYSGTIKFHVLEISS